MFFDSGLGCSHGRGRRLHAFFPERTLWSGVWRCRECVYTEGGRRAVAALISRGEHSTLRHARRHLYESRRLSGGRQASTARMSLGLQEKPLVVHLWTLCQKAESFLVK